MKTLKLIFIYSTIIVMYGCGSGVDDVGNTVGQSQQISSVTSADVNSISQPLLANNDVSNTWSGSPRTIDVITNDTATAGTIAANTLAIVGAPAHGTAVANPDGTVTYISNTGFNGTDTFTYTVNDSQGITSNIATVTISVAEPGGETVTVLKAEYNKYNTRDWLVQGTGSVIGTTVTIYIGSDLTGMVLGTVIVGTDGKWRFQLTGSGDSNSRARHPILNPVRPES